MYGMQVLLEGYWIWVAPLNGQPYQYPTEEEAYEMLSICYPDQIRSHRLGGEEKVRVFKFPE